MKDYHLSKQCNELLEEEDDFPFLYTIGVVAVLMFFLGAAVGYGIHG